MPHNHEPRTPHAAVDAVIGAGVSWVYELATGLGHWASLVFWRWLRKKKLAQFRVGCFLQEVGVRGFLRGFHQTRLTS